MNNQFDERTKSLAQSVTRRGAFKKFGIGLAAMALACFGLADKTDAAGTKTCLPSGSKCGNDQQCCSGICVTESRSLPFGPYKKVCA